MGYIKHHSIIVTGHDPEQLKPFHEKAVQIFGSLASPLIGPSVNGYVSFFVSPDGSKEGWEDSMQGDENRSTFIEYLKKYPDCPDFVEISYGGDDSRPYVLRHSKDD